MVDLHLNDSEVQLLSSALDEQLQSLRDEMIHTDDRTLKRAISHRRSELLKIAHRIRQAPRHGHGASGTDVSAGYDFVTKAF